MKLTRYIVEVNKDQILLWAALLHRLLHDDPGNELAQKCLDTLMTQTECVSRDPLKHPLNMEHIDQMCQQLYLGEVGPLPNGVNMFLDDL